MPHPTNNLKPVIEVRVNKKTSKVEWHLMWNHVSGPGAACEATSGCFTLSVDQVTCEKCLEVNAKEQP